MSPFYESQPYVGAAHSENQFILKSPQGVVYKRTLQHIKTVAVEPADDAECSTESGVITPEPAPSPELADRSTQETAPTVVTVSGTTWSEGVSQPPKALADQ